MQQKNKIIVDLDVVTVAFWDKYGDKFDSKELAHKKLTDTITLITDAITKIIPCNL